MTRILTQEWFETLPEDRQQKLKREAADLDERVKEIIRIASDGNILQEVMLIKAVESYMQDVHASILCDFGAAFLSVARLIADSMLRTIEEERLYSSSGLHSNSPITIQ